MGYCFHRKRHCGPAATFDHNHIDWPFSALPGIELSINGEVFHHIILIVDRVPELPNAIRAIAGQALVVSALVAAEDQHRPAAVFHRRQRPDGNGVVNLGRFHSRHGRDGKHGDDTLVVPDLAEWRIGNDHINVLRPIKKCCVLGRDQRGALADRDGSPRRAPRVDFVGGDVLRGRPDQEHPIAGGRLIDRAFRGDPGKLRGKIGQRCRGRVGLVPHAG